MPRINEKLIQFSSVMPCDDKRRTMSPELRNGQVPPVSIYNETPTQIQRFLHGRNILVTGGTGFMGKILVEKLLHTSATIGNIYVPIRTKRGEEPEKRLHKVLQSQVFHRVRSLLWKIVAVPANLCELGLGLSPEWRQRLCEEVSVVFHVAATTRFNAHLPYAILLNTRGTREMLELAKHMPNIVAFLHVSTTYCNTDRKTIDEVLYPPHADWRAMVKIAEKGDLETLCALTSKVIGGRRALPNTYTFSKSLAEHVVRDYAHQVPCVILRPSIVISSDREPLPGWIDNFNGPGGLMAAGGKGIVHATYVNSSVVADFVPVDIAIKAIVVAAWKKATELSREPEPGKGDLVIYNASTATEKGMTVRDGLSITLRYFEKVPFNNMIWMPSQIMTESYPLYYVAFVLLHLIPAIIADIFLKLIGNKLSLLRIQRKIFRNTDALSYFMVNSWRFENKNFLDLDSCVRGEDRLRFSFKFTHISVGKFLGRGIIGFRRYLLKEKDEDIPSARANYRRVAVIHYIVTTLLKTILVFKILNSSSLVSFVISSAILCLWITT